nr:transient receptor potential cation channel subfamily A member 1-like [Biomphalaria glabrata]
MKRLKTIVKSKKTQLDIAHSSMNDFQAPEYTRQSENAIFVYCLLSDGPVYIHKCAQSGDAKEVSRIISKDPSRINAKNKMGKTALHLAAHNGHSEVVDTLISFNADLSLQDRDGNTALHLAVISANAQIVSMLLQRGAYPKARNHRNMMAVHVAAELNNVEVIKTLLDNGVDPSWRGENGMTALHYAAAKNNGEAVSIMMENGAQPNVKDDRGYFAIHTAARCGASDAIKAILDGAIKSSWTSHQILYLKDKENNFPLHSAVNSGDIKSVRVCLSAGASLKVQQEDGSTPLHFACASGNLEMIQVMKEMNKDEFMTTITVLDAMRMTPLHRAALFDHTLIIQFLIDHGADINCRDISNSTPLLLAVSKSCWAAAQLLVISGADVSFKDKKNRNFIHIAIQRGGKLDQTGVTLLKKNVISIQNEKDDYGCIPLHYAAKEGHLSAIDELIKMGSIATLKNKDGQSSFHFAAKYGRSGTCIALLNSNYGPQLLNEADINGLTALHVAAYYGHTRIVHLLLQRGAVVCRDYSGNSALHLASSKGFTSTMRALVSVHSNLIDESNRDGDTPLHMAARNGHAIAVLYLLTKDAKILYNFQNETFFDCIVERSCTEVAVAVVNHDRWTEVIQTYSRIHGSFLLGLIKHLPSVCLTILDRCQTLSEDDPKSLNFHITYYFKYLEVPKKVAGTTSTSLEDNHSPLQSLNAMVKNNRVSCLSHPVCVTFLKVQWKRYGFYVYTCYLVVYVINLFCITHFVITLNSLKHYDYNLNQNSTKLYLYGNEYKLSLEFSQVDWLYGWIILLYNVFNIVKECGQIYILKKKYFTDIGNVVEWILYTSSILFVGPFFLNHSFHWQWASGALAVFFVWFNCLVFLQRFDFFGIYVVMFLEILRTLLQVLCVFSILFIAFGLSLYVLMFNEESNSHSTPLLSILRTFMMMIEMEYLSSFNEGYTDNRDDTIHFGKLTIILYIAFAILMPLLLMNLLIGLAVGDIESVQRNARLKRLAMQVDLQINIETMVPRFILQQISLEKFKYYPNTRKKFFNYFFRILNTQDADDIKCLEASAQGALIFDELHRQKQKLKDMNNVLEKNHHLLSQILKKMGMKSEEEDWDEGEKLDGDDSSDEMELIQVKSIFHTEPPKSQILSYIKRSSLSTDI